MLKNPILEPYLRRTDLSVEEFKNMGRHIEALIESSPEIPTAEELEQLGDVVHSTVTASLLGKDMIGFGIAASIRAEEVADASAPYVIRDRLIAGSLRGICIMDIEENPIIEDDNLDEESLFLLDKIHAYTLGRFVICQIIAEPHLKYGELSIKKIASTQHFTIVPRPTSKLTLATDYSS